MNKTWTEFYTALASALAKYTGPELFNLVQNLAAGHNFLDYMHFSDVPLWRERGNSLDPFSVIAIFNRGQTDAHRAEIAAIIAEMLGIELAPPDCYHGIPHLDPRKSIYDGDSEMWALFNTAMHDPYGQDFAVAYTHASSVRGNGLGTLSIGLFWIRPDLCMAIDKISAPWIQEHLGIEAPPEKCDGAAYQDYIRALMPAAKKAGLSFPEITCKAWSAMHPGKGCSQD